MGKGIRMEDDDMNRLDRLFWSDAMKEKSRTQRQRRPFAISTNRTGQRAPHELFVPQCRHWRQKFVLEGGVHVFASAWMDKPMLGDVSKKVGFKGLPDIGFYLDSRWASGSLLVSPGFTATFARKSIQPRIVLYPWEDWGVPENPKLFVRVVRWVLAQVKKGTVVEVACMGGHGRTGTALATILVIQGFEARAAIRRVRRSYCEEAIESDKQLAFLRAL